MAGIDVLFFWMTGLITPSIHEVITTIIADKSGKTPNLYAFPGFKSLCDSFTLGQVTDLAFCESVNTELGIGISAKLLRDKILDGIKKPIVEVFEEIQFLDPHYLKWLVVDLPQDWYGHISQNPHIQNNFPPEKVIFIADGKLKQLVPDAFDYILSKFPADKDRCLLLDSNLKRTIHSLNHGLPAAVILDAKRLKKEFLLRKMTSQVYHMHKRPE